MRLKLAILSILTILFVYNSFAQERKMVIDVVDSYTEVRERIREIKLSNDYYYYDAVGTDLKSTELDAMQLLAVYVMQQQNIDIQNVDSLLKHDATTHYYVKSDRYYVCAYIKKSSFNSSAELVAESSPETKIQLTLVDSLVACNNFLELGTELQKLHKQNRVMYGSMDKIIDINPCYILIFNPSREVVAFLAPGGIKRLNLKGGKDVMLDDYPDDFVKIWLIIY